MQGPMRNSYTRGVPDESRPSLRSEQVVQTRAALVAAGRRLFGESGFARTSVEDLAREARVTTGALYHHFRTKAALFETVFEEVHTEVLASAAQAAMDGHSDATDALARGFNAFLDAVLEPTIQRIIVTDAPAVLGLARFVELDERYAFVEIEALLRAAADNGEIEIDQPDVLARLLLGALTRAAMLLVASDRPSDTRDAIAKAMRSLLDGLRPRPGASRRRRP